MTETGSVKRNAAVATDVLRHMRLASPVLLAALTLLAGCSSKQDETLAAVKGAHSVTAEWAMTERLRAEGKTTGTYRGEMREMAKDQLASARKTLVASNDPSLRTIDAVRNDPAPSPASLAAAAQALDRDEKRLEAR
jgi:outer membrane murein-binding lipoprotein Lpp